MTPYNSSPIRKNSWIFNMVKTRYTRRIFAWAIILTISILIAASQQRYIRNFIQGPYKIGAADLDTIGDVNKAPRYFVTVNGSKSFATNIQETTTNTVNGIETSTSVSDFYLLLIGDKYLVCKSKSGPSTTCKGELTPISAELDGLLFNTDEMNSIRGSFYPFYVNDSSFRESGYCAIFYLLLLAAILVWQTRPILRFLKDPASNPVINRMQSWDNPDSIAADAQRELRSPRHKGKKGWRITDHFIIRASLFSFDMVRFSDLVWAYKKITKNSWNLIPVGKTYEVVFICKNGAVILECRKKQVDAILEFTQQHSPWAVFGFSNELYDYFIRDKEGFVSEVEQKKNSEKSS